MTEGESDRTDWPTFQGSGSRTGYAGGGAPEEPPKKPPWSVETGYAIDGPLAVAYGAVFHPGDYNSLVARDIETGEELWTFDQPDRDGKIKGGAAVVDGTVYVGSTDGHLYALDVTTGDKEWEYELEPWNATITSTPAVRDGVVYFGGENEHLHAVDADTGEEAWTMELEDHATATPLVYDDHVYIGDGNTYGTTFYAVDPEYAIADWEHETRKNFEAAPALADGTIYAPGEPGSIFALDAETGDLEWEIETMGGSDHAPVVVDGSVYFPYDNGVRSVDAETGDVEWTFETSIDWRLRAAPVVAEGIVYVAGQDQTLYAVDADSGEELWQYEPGEIVSEPVVVGGAVILGTQEGADSELLALTEGADPVSPEATLAGGMDIREAAPEEDDSDDPTAQQAKDDTDDAESIWETLDRDHDFVTAAIDRIEDPEAPTDREIQAAILGAVCDEWQTGNHAARCRSDVIAEQIAQRVPGASKGLVRQSVERLGQQGYVGLRDMNQYLLLTSRPSGIHQFEQRTDLTVINEHKLLDVLEPLYEESRENPRQAMLSREYLQEETFLTDDELDRFVWYLSDIGKWVEDVLLFTETAGYVDIVSVDSDTFWSDVELNDGGKQLYEKLS